MLRKIWNFLKEVRAEFKNVHWPSKDETTGLTSAVIVFTVLLAIIVGVFDYLFLLVVSAVMP